MNFEKNSLYLGDCLEIMPKFPDGVFDMILCDLPYGTTQNKWDRVVDLSKLWEQYERVVKNNGAIALTAHGLFTAKLILSNEKLFKYKIIWIKSKPTNFLNAKIQPLRKHEDICIFYKKQPAYHPQMTPREPYDKGIRKNQHTGSYGDFKPCHVKSNNGERYPNDVVYFDEQNMNDYVYIKTAEVEGDVIHPTQKPIALFEYLIRTYTNEGGLILDNCAGSGTTAVACLNTKRDYVLIEKEQKYHDIIQKRLAEHQPMLL